MNAKEMFEELGYEFLPRTGYLLRYKSKDYFLTFWIEEKKYIKNDYNCEYAINIKEHQAIHQQMKELGWLD